MPEGDIDNIVVDSERSRDAEANGVVDYISAYDRACTYAKEEVSGSRHSLEQSIGRLWSRVRSLEETWGQRQADVTFVKSHEPEPRLQEARELLQDVVEMCNTRPLLTGEVAAIRCRAEDWLNDEA